MQFQCKLSQALLRIENRRMGTRCPFSESCLANGDTLPIFRARSGERRSLGEDARAQRLGSRLTGALRPPKAAARRLSGLVARLGWGLASPGNSRRKKKAKTPWNCNSRDFVNWSEAEKVCVHCSRGLAAATSASHAEGRQLDPGQVYLHEWCWPSVLPI